MSKEEIGLKDVLAPTLDENQKILTSIQEDLAPASQNQTSPEENPINALQNASPDQLQEIVDTADELSSNFQSDSASAKIAFENISQILKDDAKDFATKHNEILEIGRETPDSALKVFAHISKQIISSEVEPEEKKQAVESVIKEFSFLKGGQERSAEESMEMAMNAGEGIIKSDLSDEIKGCFEVGFRNALEEIQKLKKPEKESELQELEVLEGSEEQKDQKELGSSKEEESAKSISFEDLKKISKLSLRVGIAATIAFLVPGMGFPIAIAFLVLTSPKEKKAEEISEELKLKEEKEKKLIDGKTLEEFCENLRNKAEAFSEEDKDLDTKIGQEAGKVADQESKDLENAEEILKNTGRAISRMNDGLAEEQVEEEQIDKKQVEEILQETAPNQQDQDLPDDQKEKISQPTQEGSKEQEGKGEVDPNHQTSQDLKAVMEGLKGVDKFEETDPHEPKKSDAPNLVDQKSSEDRQK